MSWKLTPSFTCWELGPQFSRLREHGTLTKGIGGVVSDSLGPISGILLAMRSLLPLYSCRLLRTVVLMIPSAPVSENKTSLSPGFCYSNKFTSTLTVPIAYLLKCAPMIQKKQQLTLLLPLPSQDRSSTTKHCVPCTCPERSLQNNLKKQLSSSY